MAAAAADFGDLNHVLIVARQRKIGGDRAPAQQVSTCWAFARQHQRIEQPCLLEDSDCWPRDPAGLRTFNDMRNKLGNTQPTKT